MYTLFVLGNFFLFFLNAYFDWLLFSEKFGNEVLWTDNSFYKILSRAPLLRVTDYYLLILF